MDINIPQHVTYNNSSSCISYHLWWLCLDY